MSNRFSNLGAMTKNDMPQQTLTPQTMPQPTTAENLAREISREHAPTVDALRSIIRHPRSLARSSASWRPPVKELPRVGGSVALTVAVTRRRVGPRARARIQGYGETHVPAYIIELRVTDPSGMPADPAVTEAWIRCLVSPESLRAVYELPGSRATSYVWLVDATYAPVLSPASMFQGLSAA